VVILNSLVIVKGTLPNFPLYCVMGCIYSDAWSNIQNTSLSCYVDGRSIFLKASVADLFECVEHIFYCKFIVQGRAVE